MAEREQFLNADMAGQRERSERRIQQEGSQRSDHHSSDERRTLDNQVAERNAEYREADQQDNDNNLGWQMHQQQRGTSNSDAQNGEAPGSLTKGQMGGEGGSTSRTSEANGGQGRTSTQE